MFIPVGMGVALLGCNEQKVAVYNTPPGVEIQAPAEGSAFDFDESVGFEGMVTDSEDEPQELIVTWESSLDGMLAEDTSDTLGLVTFHSAPLKVGAHVIILTATDTEGQMAETEIEILVQGEPDDPDGRVGAKPEVDLDAPGEGDIFLMGSPITVAGVATDADDPSDVLEVALTSTRDGVVWEGNPDESGSIEFELETLTEGTHGLTLSATDTDGRRGKAEIEIHVVADANPVVTITSPNDGDYFWLADSINLAGEIIDDQTLGEDLVVSWVSSVDGNLFAGHATSAGTSSYTTNLSAGNHDILLRATDEDGNEGVGIVAIEVRDPLDHDGDLDGYTENEGDCDDTDPYTHPGAVDVCDDLDNDCDGRINDEDWDAQEPSDSLATAIDAGVVDGSVIIDVAEWRMSGLTMHADFDEDWIVFDADDDIYDNVSVQVTVGLMPSGGDYLVELYLTDESTSVPVDSDSGGGNLIVAFTGSLWDGGEDDFAIRIVPLSWPGGSCGDAFSVTIVN